MGWNSAEHFPLSFTDHGTRELQELAVTNELTHQFCLSCQKVFEHNDALCHGTLLREYTPVSSTPVSLCNESWLPSIPSEQCYAVEECILVAFTYFVFNNEPIGKSDRLVIGVVGRRGEPLSEEHVLFCIVGHRTSRECWECFRSDDGCRCHFHSLRF